MATYAGDVDRTALAKRVIPPHPVLSLLVVSGFVGFLYVVEAFDVATGGSLEGDGVRPRDFSEWDNLLWMPLNAAATRRYEAEADWTALNATKDPKAMEGLFVNFTRKALSDPDPPGWWHALFDDHPSGLERIQMARAWQDLHQ